MASLLGLVEAPLAVASPATAASGTVRPPAVPQDIPVPVHAVASHYDKPKPVTQWSPRKVTWPAGSADLVLTNAHTATPQATTGTPATVAPPASAQVANLPVSVALAPAPHASSAQPALSPTVHVTVAPHVVATAAGVSGLVFSVQNSSVTGLAGPARLSVNYAQFQDAYGGDWATRLRLATLPACALTTPKVPACDRQTPLTSNNDTRTTTVSADVTLPAPTPSTSTSTTNSASAAAPAIVLAASASPSGGGGDYTATSLKPAGSWTAGGSADAFSWSYPITVPPVPGGLEPQVQLSYDSQSVSGLTSSTNNQASWIGDGWDYSPGYIERSYQSCNQNTAPLPKTSDSCWTANNSLTMSLGGKTSTLVQDNTNSRLYHPQDDANESVQYVGNPNGQGGGERFVVTTDDGTQYFFGLNELPGYGQGDTQTNSVWSEPVYATVSGQPCYQTTFSASECSQAYRWNLDYVKDTHNDVVSYFYTAETNSYAGDGGATNFAATSYTRGGVLNAIQYGQQDGQVYSSSPAAEVQFTSVGRCNISSSGCALSSLTSSTAGDWPDVPYDLNCTTSPCAPPSPSFWSEYMLQSIQTKALVGSTETPVDSWTLDHSFPAVADPNTQPALWLNGITHTGQDSDGGGSATAISLPEVLFTPTSMNNRVNLHDGYPWISRNRLTEVTTESGEQIQVTYTPPSCNSDTLPDPSTNTNLCYPDYWTPPAENNPIVDWFNEYVVAGVTEHDPTGGSSDIATVYKPTTGGAWHYNDNPLTLNTQRTWDQWRGFGGMTVSTGTPPDPVTSTQYTYFRGMNGDTLPNNQTRTVTLPSQHGGQPVVDADQFAGNTYETVVNNGTAVVTDTVTDPWTSAATATHTQPSGLPALQSFHTGTADTEVYTPLASGTTRETEIDDTHDSYGRVTATNDLGDVTTPTDDLCTTTTYADNTALNILDTPDETKTVSVNCTTTPTTTAQVVSDELTFYDGFTDFGTAPTVGNPTMTQKVISYNSDGSPNYATSSTTVDQYGRVLTSTDPDNRTTDTTYTPANGAEPTTVTVTDPLKYTASTTYDPLRNLRLSATDAGGYTTKEQYDALGRLTAVFKPGIDVAALTYSYTVSNSSPSVVDTNTLNDSGGYWTSETLYDSFLRATETQVQTGGVATVNGQPQPETGRDITDTVYNSDGWVSETTDPYFTTGSVSPTYVEAPASAVPSETGFTYDSAGRKTSQFANAYGSQTWQTTYSYGGDSVTTIPPAGATPTTTITDARGNTTDLYQYHTDVPADPVNDPASDYSDTHYTDTPAKKLASVTDAAGNIWTYGYDLLGNQTRSQDPDTGTTTSVYDAASQLSSTTDGRGKQTSNRYDADGRKSAAYDTTGGAAETSSDEIASWTYDTLKKGYPSSSTSYSNGDTYTQSVAAYSLFGTAAGYKYTLTGQDGSILPTAGITFGYGFTLTGEIQNQTHAAIGGLAAESTTTTYDGYGRPIGLSSGGPTGWTYVNALGYSALDQPVQYSLGSSNATVTLGLSYDPQTQALTDAQTIDSLSSGVVDNTSYSYANASGTISKGAGLVTSTTDQQNNAATTDTQCFTYDYAQRLSAAWTATDQCAATPTQGNSASVGGPSPYWQSWTYDAAGDRLTQTDHDTTGATANDTATTYNYPAAGSASDQPHTLTNTTATGPQAASDTASYTYDASGNTKSITGGSTGNQTLTWNDQGKLASDVTNAGNTAYVYDADGNLVARRDPGQTTLLIGDEQIVYNTATKTSVATRYYSIGGTTIAAATGAAAPVYLIPDRQGTDQMAIDGVTEAVTTRQYLPFGQTRGTPPATWPGGDKGYVGGIPDSTTTLENLGAREYDPASGRFLSPDSVFESNDPAQMGGYDYAGNDPITGSDPTGLMMTAGNGGPECYTAAECGGSGYQSVVTSKQNNDKKWAGYDKKAAAKDAYWRAHPPVVHKPPASSGGFWGFIQNVASAISAVAPIITVVAAATAFIPGLDVLTVGAASLADIVGAVAGVTNIVATVASGVSAGFDLAQGKLFTGGGISDLAGVALGFVGVHLSGVTGLGGVLGQAKKLASTAATAVDDTQQALKAARSAARAGGAAGIAARATLYGLGQAKNAARAALPVAEATYQILKVKNALANAFATGLGELGNYATGNAYASPLPYVPGLEGVDIP